MIHSHIDPARNLIITRLRGQLTSTELAGHLYRVIRDPKFTPRLNGVIVAEDLDAVPTAANFTILRPILKVWLTQRSGARWAVVAPDLKGKERVENFIEQLHLPGVTKCFLSEASALAWLPPAPARTEMTAW